MNDTITLQFDVPVEIANLLGGRRQAIETAKEHIILGLYQENRISGGKAAELLGLTHSGFLALLVRKGLYYFRMTPEEWKEEAEMIRSWNTSSD